MSTSGPERASGGIGEDPTDRLSLEEVIRTYRTPLRRFFAKRVRPGQDPDDLVQEVFARLAALAESSPIRDPQAFLFQIASNLLRDQGRRAATRREATEALQHHSGGNFEELSPERVLRGKEHVRAVAAALNELPERTRAIFVLHRFEELKYNEIAQRLGISASLVEKSMMDALRHLHFKLRQH